jgi:hypothetical protein
MVLTLGLDEAKNAALFSLDVEPNKRQNKSEHNQRVSDGLCGPWLANQSADDR